MTRINSDHPSAFADNLTVALTAPGPVPLATMQVLYNIYQADRSRGDVLHLSLHLFDRIAELEQTEAYTLLLDFYKASASSGNHRPSFDAAEKALYWARKRKNPIIGGQMVQRLLNLTPKDSPEEEAAFSSMLAFADAARPEAPELAAEWACSVFKGIKNRNELLVRAGYTVVDCAWDIVDLKGDTVKQTDVELAAGYAYTVAQHYRATSDVRLRGTELTLDLAAQLSDAKKAHFYASNMAKNWTRHPIGQRIKADIERYASQFPAPERPPGLPRTIVTEILSSLDKA